MSAIERRETLLDLVQLRRPLADAIEALRQFPWDSEIELVTLTRSDARRLLAAYVSGVLTASDCEAWANAIEGRDDVGLEEDAEDVLKDFLFEVATPEATHELTTSTAKDWQQRLE